MKKNNLFIIVCVVLFLLNLCLVFKILQFRHQAENSERYIAGYRDKNNTLQVQYNTLRSIADMQYNSEYRKDDLVLNYPLIKETLILRVHSNDCNDCVNNNIRILQKYKVQQHIPIVVCADFPDVKAFQSTFPQITYPVFIEKTIPTDIPKIAHPYVFLYHPDKHSADHFVYLNWQLMDVFEDYVKLLLTKTK